jgi:hypothetical protein
MLLVLAGQNGGALLPLRLGALLVVGAALGHDDLGQVLGYVLGAGGTAAEVQALGQAAHAGALVA